MASATSTGRITRYLNRSYLGKWVVIGILIGIVAGVGSTVFYFLIQIVSNTILGGITGFYPPNPAGEAAAPVSINPNFLLVPISTIIGGLLCGIIIYTFAPEAEGHGTDAAIDAFHNKGGVIRGRVPIVKMIASAFTIGTGGSAGREGPTAQIAAGFGSILGGIFKLSVKDRRIALAAGIGAGIGSIFKSPFGGAILSAEILYCGPDVESEALIPGFIATPIGYVIFASVTGFTPIFGNLTQYTFTQPINLLIYALLGILCGVVGRLYTFSFYQVKNVFDHLRIPEFVRPMIGAAIAGVIGIFFPEVLGLGYGFLQFLINGNFSSITTNYFTLPILLILILIVLVKIFATSVTVGSGGSGGVFAPALAIGAFVGASLWVVVNSLFPGRVPIPAPMVIVGMVALFAGVGRVPIAVILMVSEMTGTLQLLAPSMVAVILSYYVTGSKNSIYRSQVEDRAESPAHRGEYHVPFMKELHAYDAVNTNVVSMLPTDSVEAAYQAMIKGNFKGIPIISDKKLAGIVTMSDVLRITRDKFATTTLAEIMTKNVISVHKDEVLLDALRKMTNHGIGRLPVVDEKTGELVGIISRTDLFKAYDKYVTTMES